MQMQSRALVQAPSPGETGPGLGAGANQPGRADLEHARRAPLHGHPGVAQFADPAVPARAAADPFVAPDGTLYIAYSNFNTTTTTTTGNDNHFQVLLNKSTNGTQSFGA